MRSILAICWNSTYWSIHRKGVLMRKKKTMKRKRWWRNKEGKRSKEEGRRRNKRRIRNAVAVYLGSNDSNGSVTVEAAVAASQKRRGSAAAASQLWGLWHCMREEGSRPRALIYLFPPFLMLKWTGPTTFQFFSSFNRTAQNGGGLRIDPCLDWYVPSVPYHVGQYSNHWNRYLLCLQVDYKKQSSCLFSIQNYWCNVVRRLLES